MLAPLCRSRRSSAHFAHRPPPPRGTAYVIPINAATFSRRYSINPPKLSPRFSPRYRWPQPTSRLTSTLFILSSTRLHQSSHAKYLSSLLSLKCPGRWRPQSAPCPLHLSSLIFNPRERVSPFGAFNCHPWPILRSLGLRFGRRKKLAQLGPAIAEHLQNVWSTPFEASTHLPAPLQPSISRIEC